MDVFLDVGRLGELDRGLSPPMSAGSILSERSRCHHPALGGGTDLGVRSDRGDLAPVAPQPHSLAHGYFLR